MKIDLDEYRQRLTDELASVHDDLIEAKQAAGTVVLDQSSVGRLSRMDAMQQQAMAQGIMTRLDVRRRKLQAALARVQSGEFGLCCQCGAELEAERLRHDPSAVFCADCMAEREAASEGQG
ncbi:TraR/DksA family transcriptional regulator [Rhodocyclaceae bacterium SMB388]